MQVHLKKKFAIKLEERRRRRRRRPSFFGVDEVSNYQVFMQGTIFVRDVEETIFLLLLLLLLLVSLLLLLFYLSAVVQVRRC